MKKIGSLSASQVIASFKNDWALKEHDVKWPQDGEFSRQELPAQRFIALAKVRHPFATFPVLECSWSLAEMEKEEFMNHVRAHHAPDGGLTGSWTLNDFTIAFNRDPNIVDIQRVSNLRKAIRTGDFVMTDFIIVTSESAHEYYLASPNGTFCLLDGHHRLLALIGEDKLSNPIRVIVGELPQARLGVAVLNGRSKSE